MGFHPNDFDERHGWWSGDEGFMDQLKDFGQGILEGIADHILQDQEQGEHIPRGQNPGDWWDFPVPPAPARLHPKLKPKGVEASLRTFDKALNRAASDPNYQPSSKTYRAMQSSSWGSNPAGIGMGRPRRR